MPEGTLAAQVDRWSHTLGAPSRASLDPVFVKTGSSGVLSLFPLKKGMQNSWFRWPVLMFLCSPWTGQAHLYHVFCPTFFNGTPWKGEHKPIEPTWAWHPPSSTGSSRACGFTDLFKKASTGPSRPRGPDTPFQGETKNKQAQAHGGHVAVPFF